MTALAEHLDRHRVLVLLAELGRLTRREREIREKITALLAQPRTAAADQKLSELLQRLGGEARP